MGHVQHKYNFRIETYVEELDRSGYPDDRTPNPRSEHEVYDSDDYYYCDNCGKWELQDIAEIQGEGFVTSRVSSENWINRIPAIQLVFLQAIGIGIFVWIIAAIRQVPYTYSYRAGVYCPNCGYKTASLDWNNPKDFTIQDAFKANAKSQILPANLPLPITSWTNDKDFLGYVGAVDEFDNKSKGMNRWLLLLISTVGNFAFWFSCSIIFMLGFSYLFSLSS